MKRKKTRIFADYGMAPYGWSVGTDDIEAPYAHHFPNIPGIAELDHEFTKWSTWYGNGTRIDIKKFPWGKFNAQGIKFAKKLAIMLAPHNVDVIYCRSHGDPYEARWFRKGYVIAHPLHPYKTKKGEVRCKVELVRRLMPEHPLLLALMPPKTKIFLRKEWARIKASKKT